MAKKDKVRFSCSQMQFVSAANLGWALFEHYVADFSELKRRYKLSTAHEARAALKAAATLPDEQQRNEVPANMRTELVKEGKVCIDLYGKLKSYISSSCEPDYKKIRLKVAGQQYFNKALKNNWCSVMGLYGDMVWYIESHYDELVKGENMPDSFLKTVKQAEKNYNLLYENYKVRKQKGVATQSRIKALNACYTTMNNMLKDAKVIYRRDAAKKELFTFAHLLKALSKHKAAPAGTTEKNEAVIIDLVREMVMKMAA